MIEPTNIINLFHDALGVSVPLVLHWIPSVFTILFLFSSCVCKCVVDCMKMLSCRIFSSHSVMIRSISSLSQGLGITPQFMNILVLICLPYALASPGQSNIRGGNRNVAITLVAPTAVAIAETQILSKRTNHYKKIEQELEEMCVAKGVEYVCAP